jgi:hypothetical protein
MDTARFTEEEKETDSPERREMLAQIAQGNVKDEDCQNCRRDEPEEEKAANKQKQLAPQQLQQHKFRRLPFLLAHARRVTKGSEVHHRRITASGRSNVSQS